MTTGDWAFFFVIVITALCSVVCWVVGHVSFKDGHEAGRLYERNRQNQRRLSDQARVTPPAASPAGGYPPWATILSSRTVTARTEKMCLPAAVPELGDFVATTRFPALLATTSEMRASTDEYIGRMSREEEDYRKALTQ